MLESGRRPGGNPRTENPLKLPLSLQVHGQSIANAFRARKAENPKFRAGIKFFDAWLSSRKDVKDDVTVASIKGLWYRHREILLPEYEEEWKASKKPKVSRVPTSATGSPATIKTLERARLKITTHFTKPATLDGLAKESGPRMFALPTLTPDENKKRFIDAAIANNAETREKTVSQKYLRVMKSHLCILESVLWVDYSHCWSFIFLKWVQFEQFDTIPYFTPDHLFSGLKQRGLMAAYESGELAWDFPPAVILGELFGKLASGKVPKGGHPFPGRPISKKGIKDGCKIEEEGLMSPEKFKEYLRNAPRNVADGFLKKVPWREMPYSYHTLMNFSGTVSKSCKQWGMDSLTQEKEFKAQWQGIEQICGESGHKKATPLTNGIITNLADFLDISKPGELRLLTKLAIGQQLGLRSL